MFRLLENVFVIQKFESWYFCLGNKAIQALDQIGEHKIWPTEKA